MNYKILIVGSGQLGSRYLQGLIPVLYSLEIFVFDISPNSLRMAADRWKEAGGDLSSHRVNYISSLQEVPRHLDLCIISTTANTRLSAVLEVLQFSSVDHWILEKVLAQSIETLEQFSLTLSNAKSVWVNTPMHLWSLYQNLKQTIGIGKKLDFVYEDIRGLACNAIHYIDLVFRWNQSAIEFIDTRDLDKKWHQAERNGFWDIYGVLKVTYCDGSSLKISSKEKDRSFQVKVVEGKSVWNIDERKGIAENELGRKVEGQCEYQSALTSMIVTSIIDGNGCSLPNLYQSIEEHKMYLNAMLMHWNENMPEKTKILPIT